MVGFFAPSRSRANVGRATSRRAGKLDPAFGNSDQIALSFPIIHAVSKWRELFDSELPDTLHRRFAQSSG
jgi:hypothetical protein